MIAGTINDSLEPVFKFLPETIVRQVHGLFSRVKADGFCCQVFPQMSRLGSFGKENKSIPDFRLKAICSLRIISCNEASDVEEIILRCRSGCLEGHLRAALQKIALALP